MISQRRSSWGDNSHGGIDTNGIEGWTVSGIGGQIERVGNNYLGMTTSNGNPMIDMAASPGNIEISQTVNGLTPARTTSSSSKRHAGSVDRLARSVLERRR